MAFRSWDKQEIRLDDGTHVEAVCPVIVSASRATDIPAFFSEWFQNRLQAGYVKWTNPFNAHQVQFVSFQQTRVFVFWSKNPAPLMPILPEIEAKGIHSYFQFTLNDYEKEGLEPNVLPLQQRVDTYKALVEKVGKKRVIWRFDPCLLTTSLSVHDLTERLARVAGRLKGYTEKLVISFADISNYRNVQRNLARNQVDYQDFTPPLMTEFAGILAALNREWGLKISTCAEGVDLQRFGIEHNRCVDDRLLIELFRHDAALMNFLGYKAVLPGLDGEGVRPSLKDKGQRRECGCIISKDIGRYDTCNHVCTYCYANTTPKMVEENRRKHNPKADALVGDNPLTKLNSLDHT
jgi:hypothetical protein